MTAEQRAAFINAQTAMMQAEQTVIRAENIERGLDPDDGPAQWKEFFNRWEAVLGYNAVIHFFRQ